jgi:hypothetical protein
MRGVRLLLLVGAVMLLLAPAAAASEHVRVNEIDPATGFVELVDVLPADDPFPEPGYVVVVYDGGHGADLPQLQPAVPVPGRRGPLAAPTRSTRIG